MANYSVACWDVCGELVYDSDDPPDDGQVLLTAWADTHCQRANCPNTTAARAEAELDQPATRRELQALTARIEALEAGAP